jgi:hypothetical protein
MVCLPCTWERVDLPASLSPTSPPSLCLSTDATPPPPHAWSPPPCDGQRAHTPALSRDAACRVWQCCASTDDSATAYLLPRTAATRAARTSPPTTHTYLISSSSSRKNTSKMKPSTVANISVKSIVSSQQISNRHYIHLYHLSTFILNHSQLGAMALTNRE